MGNCALDIGKRGCFKKVKLTDFKTRNNILKEISLKSFLRLHALILERRTEAKVIVFKFHSNRIWSNFRTIKGKVFHNQR